MKRLLSAFIIAVILLLTNVSVAYALDPPDGMSIQSVKAFQNLAEDGDLAIIFHYRIPYETYTYPTTPATDSIIFRLYADNGTLLSVSRPYVYSPFETNGYGDGVSSFYFTEEDAPPWEESFDINILGVPAYYDPIQTINYEMTAADYSTAELTVDSRYALYDTILSICDTFKTIYPEVALKATTDTGVVLSQYGESYFRGAIPGLQTLCPQLFFIQVYIPERIEVEPYTMDLQTTYTERLQGTDLQRGAERIGDTMGGLSGSFVFGMIAFIGCIIACILTMRQGWGIEPGLGISTGIIILGAVLVGNALFTITMIGGLVGGMAIMFIFAYKRA